MYIYIYILYKKRNLLLRRRGREAQKLLPPPFTPLDPRGGSGDSEAQKLLPPGWLCEAVASQRALRRESEETALATPSFAPRNFVL